MRNINNLIHVQIKGQLDSFRLDVNFQCPVKGITAIYGPSGCGKTTLLRAIAGLQPMTGKLQIGDRVWQDDASDLFLPPHRRAIGYVFQESSLFPHLDVTRNLLYGLKRIDPANRRVAFEEAVELLGLTELLSRHPRQLSGGQCQRVAIARALLTSPALLLMDEPLAALDRTSKNEILPYLERLHNELAMPVMYVSHSADEVARLADYLVLLEDGSSTATGPIAELHSRLDIAYEAGNEADALIDAQLVSHDEDYQLSHLLIPGIQFIVPRLERPIGSQVRLRVMARDVSIALSAPSHTSILNIFPARIMEIMEVGPSQVLIKLDLENTVLLARITRKSAAHLALHPGKQVYAQVKAAALL